MTRVFIPGVWLALALAGCQEPETDRTRAATPAADTATTAKAASPTATVESREGPGAPIDESEIVWADAEFLASAGVKEGKDVMYLPTPPMVVDKMIELAEIGPDDLVYDLGTGDGRMAIAAAKQTGCRAIGYEIDPELVALARENVREQGLEHLVTIEERDILTLDLSPADVVLMYLTGDLNVQLVPQFRKMKPGARIVSHDWPIKGIEPDIVIDNFKSKVPDFVNLHSIYLWRTPLDN